MTTDRVPATPMGRGFTGPRHCRDTVKRVVLTSSVAAIRSHRNTKGPVNPPLYSDKDWNEVRASADSTIKTCGGSIAKHTSKESMIAMVQ